MTSTDVSARKPRGKASTPAPATLNETDALIEMLTRISRDPTVDVSKMQFALETRRALLLEAAEKEFNDAMAAAQTAMEPIVKDAPNTQTRSKYATYAALDRAIRPIYTEHGFALSFDTGEAGPDEVLVLCYVSRGRYTRTYKLKMPADGKGARGGDVMTRTHATGSAVTYGRRYLLVMIFNLALADASDDDGNRAGYRPSPAQVKTLTDGQMADYREKPSLTQAQLEASQALITKYELAELHKLMGEAGDAEGKEKVLCEHFEVPTLNMLTHAQWEVACNRLKSLIGENSKYGAHQK